MATDLVLLEEIAGVILITKQRAILLMEADFNCHNKLIFGKRMLDLASDYKLIPDKIYSAKGKHLRGRHPAPSFGL